jgi:predicted AAA+ superfamily ATPase
MNKLFELSKHRINNVTNTFYRYLFSEIDFTQKLIGIKGARGTGKTTLLLQKLKQLASEDSLYISMDNVYFSSNTLLDLAEDFYRIGGKYLYIDEVHKYRNWSQEIKNIYDSFPDLQVVFTSSSALEINKGSHDLSRRALIYELSGMSFREFLLFKYKIEFPVFTLEEILLNSNKISIHVLGKTKPYKYFQEYLESGYYPYYIEDEKNYHIRLQETINLVLEVDLPAIDKIEYNSIIKLKRLLFVIASLVPYVPNINKLAKQIGTTRDSLLKYLYLLHKAHIVRWISKEAWGINFMNKPDKLYLDNTNIAYALNYDTVNIGSIRETFFVNQISVNHKLIYSKNGDFLVDDKFTFEVGGKNKTAKQIQGIDNAYLVQDDIEFGSKGRIPLWMFGFIY